MHCREAEPDAARKAGFVISSIVFAALGAACGGGGGPVDLRVGALIWPISAASTPAPLAATFGPRIQGSTGDYDFHRGLDMPTPERTRLYAVAPGVVHHAGEHDDYNEPVVQIAHCNDPEPPGLISDCQDVFYSNYQHLASALVATGEAVAAGELVGLSGVSSAGFPHLHLEIRIGSMHQRAAVHPLGWLPYDDQDGPALSLDSIDLANAAAPVITATVRCPPSELDLLRVEAEIRSGRTGELISSQSYDVDAWNLEYTGDRDANVNLDDPDFNDITVNPGPFRVSSTEYLVEFQFRGLTSNVPADEVHAVVRAIDTVGNTASQECNPCT